MSLDISLRSKEKVTVQCTCPNCDNAHSYEAQETYSSQNITHNLNKMFDEAGIYQILWHGDGLVAGEVLSKLETALCEMRAEPDRFSAFNAANGWGKLEHAIGFLMDVIRDCKEHPEAILHCSC